MQQSKWAAQISVSSNTADVKDVDRSGEVCEYVNSDKDEGRSTTQRTAELYFR